MSFGGEPAFPGHTQNTGATKRELIAGEIMAGIVGAIAGREYLIGGAPSMAELAADAVDATDALLNALSE